MTTPDIDQLPPHSPEAEQGILGCVLLDDTLAGQLRPEWFYELKHREIADAILVLAAAAKPVDTMTVRVALREKGKLDEIGGQAYLSELADATPGPSMFSHWRGILEDKAKLRLVIRVGTESAAKASEPGASGAEILDAFERDALAIRRAIGKDTGETDLKATLSELTDDWDAVMAGSAPPGIKTGFYDLDKLIGGLKPQQLFVIAARPSVGKTSLALNIAERVVLDDHLPVGFFSLEMSSKELLQRLVCGRARVDASRLNEGKPSEQDIRKLTVAQAAIFKAPLRIVDKGGLSMAQLTGLARHMTQQHELKLLIVDYLGLLRSGERSRSRYDETTLVSNGLKVLAKELNLPVIALAQLNRDSDRENRPPRLSDLRDSGAIEQDADIVALLHRGDDQTGDMQKVDLILAKQRNGRTGRVQLLFHRAFTRFESAAFEKAYKAA